jgi:hypothetical protein
VSIYEAKSSGCGLTAKHKLQIVLIIERNKEYVTNDLFKTGNKAV